MTHPQWLPMLCLAAAVVATPAGGAPTAPGLIAAAPPFAGTGADMSAAQTPSLVGTFVWDSAASDDVRKAINDGTHHMSFITKPFARKRLRATNVPYRRIVIALDSTHLSLQTDQRAPILIPQDGSPIEWTREDGEVLQVSLRWQGDTLHVTFRAGDGTRENRYALAPDGRTMHMHVTITSPRLPGPIEYTLAYRRS